MPAFASRESLPSSFREVAIVAIIVESGLKRPVLRTYFRDRSELIIRVSQRVLSELVEAAQQSLASTTATRDDLVHALESATPVYHDHLALAGDGQLDVRQRTPHRFRVRDEDVQFGTLTGVDTGGGCQAHARVAHSGRHLR